MTIHLATIDRRSEDVRVHAVVVPELELGNIERHVFTADLVEGSDDAALEDRPEAFNRLSMNGTDNVLPFGMVDDAVVIFLPEVSIGPGLV